MKNITMLWTSRSILVAFVLLAMACRGQSRLKGRDISIDQLKEAIDESVYTSGSGAVVEFTESSCLLKNFTLRGGDEVSEDLAAFSVLEEYGGVRGDNPVVVIYPESYSVGVFLESRRADSGEVELIYTLSETQRNRIVFRKRSEVGP